MTAIELLPATAAAAIIAVVAPARATTRSGFDEMRHLVRPLGLGFAEAMSSRAPDRLSE